MAGAHWEGPFVVVPRQVSAPRAETRKKNVPVSFQRSRNLNLLHRNMLDRQMTLILRSARSCMILICTCAS